MYRFDIVYIWQNQTGEYAPLNGLETRVLKGPMMESFDGDPPRICWLTDTVIPADPGDLLGDWAMYAYTGDLRPKDPPADVIRDLVGLSVPALV